MNVKKLTLFTTVCAIALCAGVNIAIPAAAESGLTIPEDFSVKLSLDGVTDYSAEDSSFALAYGNNIYVYTADETSGNAYSDGTLETYAHSAEVTKVEYSGGSLYFADASKTYLYSEGTAESADFSFTQYSDSDTITNGNYLYYIMNNYLSIIDKQSNTLSTTPEADYRSLKLIDGTVYVLKDNALCTISGDTITELELYYDDYSAIAEISMGGTADALKAASIVQTAAVAENACLIRVDEDFSGDYFTSESVTFADGGETAQILYSPDGGNAALIAIGSKFYLTLKTSLTATEFTLGEASMTYAYLLDGAGVYSLPLASENCLLATLSGGDVVTVTGTVTGGAFACDYYKVEYTTGGDTVTGYVAAGLLSPYTFASDDAADTTTTSGEETGNIVTTVVLVLIIVCLVLVAIGYITYVATAGEKGKRKK